MNITVAQTMKLLAAARREFQRAAGAKTCVEAKRHNATGQNWFRLGTRGFVKLVPRYRWDFPEESKKRTPEQNVIDQAHGDAYVAAYAADEAIRRCAFDAAKATRRRKTR